MQVLITRQIEQSEKFSLILKKNNIKNIVFPLIAIKNIHLNVTNKKNLDQADIIIFTSQNSVYSLLKEVNINSIKSKKIIAIGKSTETVLNKMRIKVDIVPENNYTSESLLDEIEKHRIIDKKIIIIKGIGGRSLLHKKLSKNNFLYNDVNIYERIVPITFSSLSQNTLNSITHICITSVEILCNLEYICQILKLEISKNMVFVAGNNRIAKEIVTKFFNYKILISKDPTNDEMLKTLLSST